MKQKIKQIFIICTPGRNCLKIARADSKFEHSERFNNTRISFCLNSLVCQALLVILGSYFRFQALVNVPLDSHEMVALLEPATAFENYLVRPAKKSHQDPHLIASQMTEKLDERRKESLSNFILVYKTYYK